MLLCVVLFDNLIVRTVHLYFTFAHSCKGAFKKCRVPQGLLAIDLVTVCSVHCGYMAFGLKHVLKMIPCSCWCSDTECYIPSMQNIIWQILQTLDMPLQQSLFHYHGSKIIMPSTLLLLYK